MQKLTPIPVYLESLNPCSSKLLPILTEMLEMLKTLISSGQGDIIDLTYEPLGKKDIADLNLFLGLGEINTVFSSLQTTTNIRETSVSGIWWITHYNQDGSKLREYIEITTCPDLLKTVPEELQSALSVLQDKISVHTNQSSSDAIARRLKEIGLHTNTTDSNNIS